MQVDPKTYRVTENSKVGIIGLIIGIVGLALSGIGYMTDSAQFFHSYLVAFFFWLTIALGGLFFTLLHDLVQAKWSIVIRRIAESIMTVLPLMALFAIPVFLGIHELYHWSHADVVAHDEILQKKAGYLNVTFFIIRAVVYFAIWIIFALLLYKKSLQMDKTKDSSILVKLRRISAPGMILFALTSTFAAFDWLMSLDPHWYSTIFGVYVFSGSFLAVLSFIILVVLYQRHNEVMRQTVTVEHCHDLAKLTFGFVIFWAYMGFSQYFLMWYANIPEETVWYLHRWQGDWKDISLVIIFGHFAIPFVVLITRAAKRSFPVLLVISVWLLFVHWVDLYWLVLPNLYNHEVHLSWIDLTTMVGIGGVFVWYFWRRYTSQPLVPIGDPGLQKSIDFVNI